MEQDDNGLPTDWVLNAGNRIGSGATAEVFAVDDRRALKLFRRTFPKKLAEVEYAKAKAVQECGVPAPRALEWIEAGDRVGIVYERVRGKSMLYEMLVPWKSRPCAGRMAALQHEINTKKPVGLPSFKEGIRRNIQATPLLAQAEKEAVLAVLDPLPEGDGLCHGDFHPDNIVLNHGRPVVLDWMTACVGSPAADAARSALILTTSELPEGIPGLVRGYVQALRKSFNAAYLEGYCALSGCTPAQIDAWKLPMTAARLVESRPPRETDLLLGLIRGWIGGKQCSSTGAETLS